MELRVKENINNSKENKNAQNDDFIGISNINQNLTSKDNEDFIITTDTKLLNSKEIIKMNQLLIKKAKKENKQKKKHSTTESENYLKQEFDDEKIIEKEEIINDQSKKLKVVDYKGKQKSIPACNEDSSLCEFFIIRKMRYCRFKKVFSEELKDKYKDQNLNGEFCVYHQPMKEDPENEFILCPLDNSHSVKKSNLQKHLKKCNYLVQKDKVKNNIWYKYNANTCLASQQILAENNFSTEETIESLYSNCFWEALEEDQYSHLLNKILLAYTTLRNDYESYLNSNAKVKDFIIQKNLKVSALDIDIEKDLLCTAQLPKYEKTIKQNEAITNILRLFNILSHEHSSLEKQEHKNNKSNEQVIFIEFGAGKAGLSHFINSQTGNQTVHYLLERGSNRNKKDKYSEKLIRYKTDIKDFDVDYIDEDIKNKINKSYPTENCSSTETVNYKLLGIAKHICGCALDLSLTCLLNFSKKDKIKGFCLATCCHNICRLEYINNLRFFKEKLNFELKEIIYLFKATSWLFGSIDPDKVDQMLRRKKSDNKILEENEIPDDVELGQNNNEEDEEDFQEELNRIKDMENNNINHPNKNPNLNSKKVFEQIKLKKEYFGLICKYIIDFSRVFFLINQGFHVFYLKYCGNEITTENNLILALNDFQN